jgi:hypothetical protein
VRALPKGALVEIEMIARRVEVDAVARCGCELTAGPGSGAGLGCWM